MTGSNTCGKVLWSEDWRREARESLEVRGLTRDSGTGARKVWKGSREENTEGRKGENKTRLDSKVFDTTERKESFK